MAWISSFDPPLCVQLANPSERLAQELAWLERVYEKEHADQEQVDLAVGRYIIGKYRTGAAERGYAAVAAQLKKQGIPFEVACTILNVRSTT